MSNYTDSNLITTEAVNTTKAIKIGNKIFPFVSKVLNDFLMGYCTNLGVMYDGTNPMFSWEDPADLVVSGSTLAYWDSTVLVRKAGGVPVSHLDGTILAQTSATNNNRDYYKTHSYTDTTRESGVTYYYKLFSRSEGGRWNNLSENVFDLESGPSWNQVQQVVRSGNAASRWPVGTVFYVQHSEYASDSNGLAFRVSGYDQVPAADSTLTHTMCLEMVDLLFKAPYDAPEKQYALTEDTTAQSGKTYYKYEDSTYTALVEGTDYNVGDPVPENSWYEKNETYRVNYGNNYYPYSNQLQWANSSGNANAWFVPKHIWDLCGTTLSQKNGFLKNIESAFVSVVQPASLVTWRGSFDGGGSITTTTEKFWPLSISQVFGQQNSSVTENEHLQYYADGGSAVKKILGTNTAFQWRLRSALGNLHNTYYVPVNGTWTGDVSGALNPYGISLACIIA